MDWVEAPTSGVLRAAGTEWYGEGEHFARADKRAGGYEIGILDVIESPPLVICAPACPIGDLSGKFANGLDGGRWRGGHRASSSVADVRPNADIAVSRAQL
jgi:hypothetical protein